MKRATNKQRITKAGALPVCAAGSWKVLRGELKPRKGKCESQSLFRVVAEKIPKDALSAVSKDMKDQGLPRNGVYIAHDSMGYARYIGRGAVFSRLRKRFRKAPLELHYFSFYIVAIKQHEREIETLLIRAAGPHLHFNTKKKRVDIRAGNVRDFEAGTIFYERRRGREVERAD